MQQVHVAGQPSKIVQYGHGLFGNYGEVESGYLVQEAHDNKYILAATVRDENEA